MNTSEIVFRKAGQYGLQEFLEIMGELSQESIKKGRLSRLQKELITLGVALFKNCHRCIDIHRHAAETLHATDDETSLIKKVILFMNAAPHGDSELWSDWVDSWNNYSYSRKPERQRLREMTALAIAIVKQHEKQIELHMTTAMATGVVIEEIFEVVPIVLLMDGAPTLSQIPHIVGCYEKLSAASS